MRGVTRRQPCRVSPYVGRQAAAKSRIGMSMSRGAPTGLRVSTSHATTAPSAVATQRMRPYACHLRRARPGGEPREAAWSRVAGSTPHAHDGHRAGLPLPHGRAGDKVRDVYIAPPRPKGDVVGGVVDGGGGHELPLQRAPLGLPQLALEAGCAFQQRQSVRPHRRGPRWRGDARRSWPSTAREGSVRQGNRRRRGPRTSCWSKTAICLETTCPLPRRRSGGSVEANSYLFLFVASPAMFAVLVSYCKTRLPHRSWRSVPSQPRLWPRYCCSPGRRRPRSAPRTRFHAQ